MSDSIILLVGGKLRSGKDAFADHLVATEGYTKLGMSDILAEALYVLNPIIPVPRDESYFGAVAVEFFRYRDYHDNIAGGYVQAKTNPEVRALLQRLGTEVGRDLLGQNIWVDAIKKKIDGLLAAGVKKIVVTGIRFPNELNLENAWLQSGPFQTDHITAASIWIERPSLEQGSASHSSEGSVSMKDFEYAILNDGSLEDLYGNAGQLLDSIKTDYS